MIVGSIGNILDGNIYLVSQGENIRQTQQTDFDGMINQISSGSESLDDIFKDKDPVVTMTGSMGY